MKTICAANTMRHTPGPWRITKHPTKYPDLFIYDIIQAQPDPDFNRVCGIAGGLDSKADAEFICQACNSHEDLLEACKQAVDDWHADDANFDIEEPKYLEMARQAITRAEGR